MASIFRRGKQGIWCIKYYVNGRQAYYSLNTIDARIAKKMKRQIEGQEAKGELLAPSKTPLPVFLEDFCRFLATTRTPKSYSADVSVLRVFFGPICSALLLGSHVNKRWRSPHSQRLQDTMKHVHVNAAFLEQISASKIEGFITQRIRDDGIAPKTANRYREVLHRMFNFAISSWNFVSPDRRNSNPAAMVERRREPASKIRFPTLPEIDKQLEVLAKAPTLRVIVATLIYAGLRREEALRLFCMPITMRLTVDDVDLDKRLIYVRAKLVNGEYWQPKTKRNRTVPISSALHEILARYNRERQGPWFFPSTRGFRWDPDNFSQDLRQINRSCGLNCSSLDFRHTFGSHLAQKGESLYKIAELMGNSPEICRRHYAALVPEKMHDVVEFESGTSGKNEKTEEMLQQILDKLERPRLEQTKPKLRMVKSHG
jgi:integrase